MEHAGSSPPGRDGLCPGVGDAASDSGERLVRLVDSIDGRLRALRESLDARDAAEIAEVTREFAEIAREEVDCDLIGLEEDDGLVEEMQLSLLTERVEDLIAFCRMAMEDAARDSGPDEAGRRAA